VLGDDVTKLQPELVLAFALQGAKELIVHSVRQLPGCFAPHPLQPYHNPQMIGLISQTTITAVPLQLSSQYFTTTPRRCNPLKTSKFVNGSENTTCVVIADLDLEISNVFLGMCRLYLEVAAVHLDGRLHWNVGLHYKVLHTLHRFSFSYLNATLLAAEPSMFRQLLSISVHRHK
jgi:hypothetical protein